VETNGPTYYVCAACLVERHEDCACVYEPGTCACACRYAAEGASRRAHQQGGGHLRLIVSPQQDSHGQRVDEDAKEGAAEASARPTPVPWAPLLGL